MMWVRSAAAIIVFVSALSAAAADDFSRPCPADSYMTGFEGYAGAWIDSMRILCAHWNAKSEKLDQPIKVRDMVGRSGGGSATSAHCPEGWLIAGGFRPNYVWGDDDDVPVLHSIQFSCRSLDEARFVPRTFGSNSSVADRADDEMVVAGECPEGALFARGITGGHRRFVEALGFTCDSGPKAPAIKATRPPGPDAFRETMTSKRKGGVLIESGEPPMISGRRGGDLIGSGAAPPPPPVQPTATAKADVNIHQEASGESPRIGILRKDRTVAVLGHDLEKRWYRLEFKGVPGVPDGAGWVAADWLTINP